MEFFREKGHKKVAFVCNVCSESCNKNYVAYSFKPTCQRCLLGVKKFLAKAAVTHGDRYEYDLSTYKHSKEKMDITCKTHGVFSQRPGDHIMGQNCPSCGKEASNTALKKSHDSFI